MSEARHTPDTRYYVGDISQPSGKYTIYAYGDRSIPRALVTRKDEASLFAAAADLLAALEALLNGGTGGMVPGAEATARAAIAKARAQSPSPEERT